MTVKEFAESTGIEYSTVSIAVNESEYHRRGKNVQYEPEQIREAVMDYLKDREKILEGKLAAVRRSIVSAYDMGGGQT